MNPYRIETQGVPLTRDTGARKSLLVHGGILFAIATPLGVMTPSWGFAAGMGAFIFGASALCVVVASFGFHGRGPCPACGNELRGVPKEADGFPCSACGLYATIRGGVVLPTADDAVARTPTYSIRIETGRPAPFGHLCVGCGHAATRTLPQTLTRNIIGMPGMPRVVKRWDIDVPFCDEHAKLGSLGQPTGITGFDGDVCISSYKAWRIATGRAREESAGTSGVAA